MNTNRYLPSLGDAELQDTMERIYRKQRKRQKKSIRRLKTHRRLRLQI